MNLPQNIDFFIQARMSSSRLPHKVLHDLMGHPILYHVCARAGQSKFVRTLVVVTSTNSEDNEIESMCDKYKIKCFRGSLDDVLDRYYQAALHYQSQNIVRITADCPCIDAGLIDQLIEFYFENNFDYASNASEPSYPDGLDTEIFSFQTLERMHKDANLKYQREHVTQYAHTHPGLFKMGSFKSSVDNSRYRVTLDTPADLQLIQEIYKRLYNEKSHFTYKNLINLLETEVNLLELNNHLIRNSSLIEQKAKELKDDH